MNAKQLLKSVVFLLGALFITITITYITRTDGDVKERFVGFYAEKENTIDVLMVGSSPVYPGYATPKLWGEHGIATYPLSSNQQRPRAAKHLVEEARKTQDPSLYVFEIRQFTAPEKSMIDENYAYTRGVTDNMKYSWNRIKTINDLVDDKSIRYTFYFDIFKYHSNWKTMILPRQLKCFAYEWPEELKGHVASDNVGPSEIADYSHITGTMPIPSEEEECLYELLDYLKQENLNALFIVTPYTMTEEKQKMYNYMQPIIESYGYNFLNMNDNYEEIGIDFATDFYDYGGHLNALGAEKVTGFFGDYLSRNYTFEDKRGLQEYSSWDEGYELWKTTMEEARVKIAKRIEQKDFMERVE